jgi:hypothetical protein
VQIHGDTSYRNGYVGLAKPNSARGSRNAEPAAWSAVSGDRGTIPGKTRALKRAQDVQSQPGRAARALRLRLLRRSIQAGTYQIEGREVARKLLAALRPRRPEAAG